MKLIRSRACTLFVWILATGCGGFKSTKLPTEVTQGLEVCGEAIISWETPSKNLDGTNLTDLASYNVYWGSTPGTYFDKINHSGFSPNQATIKGLTPGVTYYFAVSTVNAVGDEGPLSNEVSKLMPVDCVRPQ